MDYRYFLKTTTVRPSAELSVYQYGYETCVPGQNFGPTTRDYYLMHYVVSGKGTYAVGDKVHEISANEGFLICPGVVTFYQSDSEDPWTYYWVGFNGSEAKTILKQANLGDRNLIFTHREDNRLIDLLFSMTQLSDKSENLEFSALGLLYRFLSILVSKATINQNAETTHTESYTSRAIRLMEENYTKDIKISDIAKALKIDRSHFYRIFKSDMQISPQEFLLSYRLNRACSLLRSSDFSLAEISEMLRFSDQMYFSKIFKKRFGITPSSYRKHPFDGNVNITID